MSALDYKMVRLFETYFGTSDEHLERLFLDWVDEGEALEIYLHSVGSVESGSMVVGGGWYEIQFKCCGM